MSYIYIYICKSHYQSDFPNLTSRIHVASFRHYTIIYSLTLIWTNTKSLQLSIFLIVCFILARSSKVSSGMHGGISPFKCIYAMVLHFSYSIFLFLVGYAILFFTQHFYRCYLFSLYFLHSLPIINLFFLLAFTGMPWIS